MHQISTENSHMKRMRTGSISGRLRTASDLEESGIIDKYQKGIIKDLIISGDIKLQQSLDKCEQGDTSSLEDMIKRGVLARKHSIDLLDGLDFDFLNGMKTEDDIGGVFDDDLMFDFRHFQHDQSGQIETKPSGDHPHRGSLDLFVKSHQQEGTDKHAHHRTASMDSNFSGNFRMFDNLPMFRGHSFGDEANLINGTDIDNLYNEDERFDTSLGEHGLYSIGNHTPHNYYGDSAALVAENSVRKLSDLDQFHDHQQQQTNTPQQQGHVELSAYEVHAASLHSGGAMTKNTTKSMNKLNKTKSESGASFAKNKSQSQPGGSQHNEVSYLKYGGAALFTGDSASGSAPSQRKTAKESKQSASDNQHAYSISGSTGTHHSQQHHNRNSSSHVATHSSLFADPTLFRPDDNDPTGGGLYKLSSSGGVGFIGAYSPEQRRLRIEKFFEKRNRRVWTKKVKYDVRKNFADSRLRVKGRFVKKEDEDVMRELLTL